MIFDKNILLDSFYMTPRPPLHLKDLLVNYNVLHVRKAK